MSMSFINVSISVVVVAGLMLGSWILDSGLQTAGPWDSVFLAQQGKRQDSKVPTQPHRLSVTQELQL